MDKVEQKVHAEINKSKRALGPFDIHFTNPADCTLIHGSMKGVNRLFSKSGRVALWKTNSQDTVSPAAFYAFERSGWMNKNEYAALAFQSETIIYRRHREQGTWFRKGKKIGSIVVNGKMRNLRLGKGPMTLSEQAIPFGEVALPLVGPGTRGAEDCKATLTTAASKEIPLVLQSRATTASQSRGLGAISQTLKGNYFSVPPNPRLSPILSVDAMNQLHAEYNSQDAILISLAQALWCLSLYLF